MKFKTLVSLVAVLVMGLPQAFAQSQPRPIFASSIYNGTGVLFVPTSTPLGNRACILDNNSTIASSVTTSTELSYLSGATSNLQAQISAITPGAVLSVFGRVGAVTALIGDYSAFYPLRSNNLSDLTNAAAARTNLGLGSAAVQPATAFDTSGAAAAAQAAAQAASDPLGSAAAAQAAAQAASDPLGSAATAQTNAQTSSLQKANNLSDLASKPTARTNLGLGTAATQPSGAFDSSGAAAAAQAAAQASSLQKAANLSDVANAATSRTNLGLGTAATQNTGAFDATGSAAAVQASSLQKAANLSDVANAATSRTNLGLGSAAVQPATAFDASGAAATAQAASLQKASNLSDLASVPTARTNLGLGSAALQPTGAFDSSGAAAAAQAASLQKTSNLSDLTDVPAARTNLGLGTAALQPFTAFVTSVAGTAPIISSGGANPVITFGSVDKIFFNQTGPSLCPPAGEVSVYTKAGDSTHIYMLSSLCIETQISGSLGYVAENVANKSTDGTLAANSDTLYPSQKAVKTYVDALTAGAIGYTPTVPGNWSPAPTTVLGGLDQLAARPVGAGSSFVEWKISGDVGPMVDFGNPHFCKQAQSLSSVDVSMLNSGTSGAVTFQLNQFRAGALVASFTGSMASGAGLPKGATVVLSGTFNILVGDIMTADITGAPGGAPEDITIAFSGG